MFLLEKGIGFSTNKGVRSRVVARSMAAPRRVGGRKISGVGCLNNRYFFLIAVTLGISWWYNATHHEQLLHPSRDLLADLSPSKIAQLPLLDNCKSCGHCVVESHQLSTPSVCAQPDDDEAENSRAISTGAWRLSSDYKDQREMLPHCPICRGCVHALENVDEKIRAFNTTFVHKSGASRAWYFYTNVKCPGKSQQTAKNVTQEAQNAESPSGHAENPRSQAVVKMWCFPFDHALGVDPYDPLFQRIRSIAGTESINKMYVQPTTRAPEHYCNKTMPYEVAQKEISMMRIAEECGLSTILPKVWVGPVKAIMPETGYPIDMDALWQTRASGVSLYNIAHWSTKPGIILKALKNRVNSTQVVMAAIFDLLTSQCDRNSNNIFLDEEGGITLIDNNQALAHGHMCDIGRQLSTIFLPSSAEHTFRAVGKRYAKYNKKGFETSTPAPHVMMDYRCHTPGGKIGTDYPPRVKQCLTKFMNMDVEGLLYAFGLIDSKSASLLKSRASAMLHHGFEWTLLNAQPLSSDQYRYSPQPPCCKMHSVRSIVTPWRFECDDGWKSNPNLHRPKISQ